MICDNLVIHIRINKRFEERAIYLNLINEDVCSQCKDFNT